MEWKKKDLEVLENVLGIYDMPLRTVRRVQVVEGSWRWLDVRPPLLVMRMKPCGSNISGLTEGKGGIDKMFDDTKEFVDVMIEARTYEKDGGEVIFGGLAEIFNSFVAIDHKVRR